MSKCPVCGADSGQIERAVRGEGRLAMGSNWRQREGQVMAMGDQVVQAGMVYERKEPAGQARREDVVVTAWFSIGSMLVLLVAGAVLSLVFWDARWLKGLAGMGVAVFVLLWFVLLFESRQLLWVVEKVAGKDLDGDQQVGRPKRQAQNRGRTVIYPHDFEEPVNEWSDLSAEKQVADIWKFALVVMRRQAAGLAVGQKALRGYVLPSRFEVTDDLHKELVGTLRLAGFVRDKGRGWELMSPKSEEEFRKALAGAIKAEDW